MTADSDPDVVMVHYTIYQNPADYPHYKYVCRRWTILRGNPEPVADKYLTGAANDDATLDLLRSGLEARGLYRLDRFDEDDPAILEVWI